MGLGSSFPLFRPINRRTGAQDMGCMQQAGSCQAVYPCQKQQACGLSFCLREQGTSNGSSAHTNQLGCPALALITGLHSELVAHQVALHIRFSVRDVAWLLLPEVLIGDLAQPFLERLLRAEAGSDDPTL